MKTSKARKQKYEDYLVMSVVIDVKTEIQERIAMLKGQASPVDRAQNVVLLQKAVEWFLESHRIISAAAAQSLHSCPTLCDPIDSSPPDSPVPGILQERTLEWVVIFFSNAWKWKVKVKSLSCVRLLETPWTAAYQAPPSMGFSRQEYWSGLPLPSPSYYL